MDPGGPSAAARENATSLFARPNPKPEAQSRVGMSLCPSAPRLVNPLEAQGRCKRMLTLYGVKACVPRWTLMLSQAHTHPTPTPRNAPWPSFPFPPRRRSSLHHAPRNDAPPVKPRLLCLMAHPRPAHPIPHHRHRGLPTPGRETPWGATSRRSWRVAEPPLLRGERASGVPARKGARTCVRIPSNTEGAGRGEQRRALARRRLHPDPTTGRAHTPTKSFQSQRACACARGRWSFCRCSTGGRGSIEVEGGTQATSPELRAATSRGAKQQQYRARI